MILFFDTNVVLDNYLQREHSDASRNMLRVVLGAGHSPWVAWHSAATAYYIFRSRSKLPDADCRQHLYDLIGWAEVVPAGSAELQQALSFKMRDFEDAMQIAAAVKCAADAIITRNTSDFTASPIPAYTPEDFLTQYFTPPSP